MIETANYTEGRASVMKHFIVTQTVAEEPNDQSSEIFVSKSSSEDDSPYKDSVDDEHKPISVHMSASFHMLQ